MSDSGLFSQIANLEVDSDGDLVLVGEVSVQTDLDPFSGYHTLPIVVWPAAVCCVENSPQWTSDFPMQALPMSAFISPKLEIFTTEEDTMVVGT